MFFRKLIIHFSLLVLIIAFFQVGCSDSSNPLSNIDMKVQYVSQLPKEYNFYSTDFINEDLGWAVGKNGVIFHTSDGGKIWVPQNSTVSDDLLKVQFLDENNGWVAGTNNVLFTNNAGRTWQSKLSNVDFSKLVSLFFIDKNIGSVSGTPDGKIYSTSDAGATWTVEQVAEMGRIIELSFVDKSIGYSLNNVSGVYKTSNGGQNWDKTNFPRFCSTIYFLNTANGFAGNNIMPSSLGNDKAEIFITNDAGNSWTGQKIPDATAVWKVEFVNSTVGFAISGGVCGFSEEPSDWVECGELIYSSNGGNDWGIYNSNSSLKEVIDFKTYSKNKLNVLTKSGEIYFFEISF